MNHEMNQQLNEMETLLDLRDKEITRCRQLIEALQEEVRQLRGEAE